MNGASESMVMHGSIKDIGIADLIQHSCQLDGKSTRIILQSALSKAVLYCDNGNLVHAELDDMVGDSVVFKVLEWEEGEFSVNMHVESPGQSIFSNYTQLLFEGAIRTDEAKMREDLQKMTNSVDQLTENVTSSSDQNNSPDGMENMATVISGDVITNEPSIVTTKNVAKSTRKKSKGRVSKKSSAKIKKKQDETKLANVSETLTNVMSIDGTIACALVDWSSGTTLGTMGNGMDIETAATGNTNVIRAKTDVMKNLNISGIIEDMLITLQSQYHLIRILKNSSNMFLYVALDRSKSNLGMARHKLAEMENEIKI